MAAVKKSISASTASMIINPSRSRLSRDRKPIINDCLPSSARVVTQEVGSSIGRHSSPETGTKMKVVKVAEGRGEIAVSH